MTFRPEEPRLQKRLEMPAPYRWGVLVFFAIFFLLGSFFYLRLQKRILLENTHDVLRSILNLKISQITAWRLERLDDARFFTQNPFFTDALNRWAQERSEGLRARLRGVMGDFARSNRHYESLFIVDEQGKVLLSTDKSPPLSVSDETRKRCETALRDPRPTLADFYYCDYHKTVHLSVVSGLLPRRGAGGGARFALVMRIDPGHFLFPHVKTWPITSRTAETLIVRREGNKVVFLGETRHRAASHGELWFPVDNHDLPAAKAVRGIVGVADGVDYRGVSVLACVDRVPDANWFMVAKIDKAEALSPLRRAGAYFFVVAALLSMVMWAGLRLKAEKEAAEAIRKSEERTRELFGSMEPRVQERTAELTAANRELEAFTYSVSHDLRAPLRAMDGFSKSLVEDFGPELPREVQRRLEVVRDNTVKMARLIEDLLAFSKLARGPIHSERIDMARLAQDVWREASSCAAKPAEVEWGELPPAVGDPSLIRQVWVNLVSNALKFSRGREHPRVWIGARADDGEVVYYVKDNGAGYDARYSHKLFGVFQRLHTQEEFEGNGVGLALVQRLVGRHGGRVWAEGEVDKGAAFFFTLPSRKKMV